MSKKQLVVAFSMMLIAWSASAQQPPKIDRSYQFVAQIYLVRPKAGMEQKFEEALKQHVHWLAQQHETWKWITWQMLSGEDFGSYAIGTFNHRWRDFDAHAQLSEGERAHWDATVALYADNTKCLYYKKRPEMSYDKSQGSPLYEGLKFVHVKLESTTEFGQSVRKMQEALEKTDFVPASLWFQMIRGAEHPLYLWLMPMKSLDELEPPPGKSVPELVLQHFGQKDGMAVLQTMVKTVQVYNSEIARVRSDLSYTPPGH